MPAAKVPRSVPNAKSERSFRECWHMCPNCHKDHMHTIGFQGAKLDVYYRLCEECKSNKEK